MVLLKELKKVSVMCAIKLRMVLKWKDVLLIFILYYIHLKYMYCIDNVFTYFHCVNNVNVTDLTWAENRSDMDREKYNK